jgi:hypothetical protein
VVIFNLELKPFKTEISKMFRQGSNFYIGDPVDRFGLHGTLKVGNGYKRYVNTKTIILMVVRRCKLSGVCSHPICVGDSE